MKGFLPVFGFALLFVFTAVCWAEGNASLYEAEVQVADQSPEQRQQAVRKALDEVLDQVADERDVTISRKTRNMVLRKAESYVQQYGYTDRGLWVRFDRRALDKWLLGQDGESTVVEGSGVLLKVSGVRTLADYVRVMEYLESQRFARGVQPVAIEPETVLFELEARGEPDAIARAIGRDSVLQWLSEDAGVLSFLYSP